LFTLTGAAGGATIRAFGQQRCSIHKKSPASRQGPSSTRFRRCKTVPENASQERPFTPELAIPILVSSGVLLLAGPLPATLLLAGFLVGILTLLTRFLLTGILLTRILVLTAHLGSPLLNVAEGNRATTTSLHHKSEFRCAHSTATLGHACGRMDTAAKQGGISPQLQHSPLLPGAVPYCYKIATRRPQAA
jgi:hypothetical protein